MTKLSGGCIVLITLLVLLSLDTISGFLIATPGLTISCRSNNDFLIQQQAVADSETSNSVDEIIAKRIIVTGPAVQGGYYRSCVLNEVRHP